MSGSVRCLPIPDLISYNQVNKSCYKLFVEELGSLCLNAPSSLKLELCAQSIFDKISYVICTLWDEQSIYGCGDNNAAQLGVQNAIPIAIEF